MFFTMFCRENLCCKKGVFWKVIYRYINLYKRESFSPLQRNSLRKTAQGELRLSPHKTRKCETKLEMNLRQIHAKCWRKSGLFCFPQRKSLPDVTTHPPPRRKSFPLNKAVLMAGFPHYPGGITGLLLGFFLAVTLYTIIGVIIPNVMAGATASIKFRIYGSSEEIFHDVPLRFLGTQVVDDYFYHRSKPTVFYFHGFTESPTSDSVVSVVSALMSLNPRPNIIVVDWSIIAGNPFYPIPALMSGVVGERIAFQIDKWIKHGKISAKNIRLVGHSLGAQCAGFVAKMMFRGPVPILVGLDPAFPGFFFKGAHKLHLWHTDADMVTVIHTDAGVYGVPYNTGWADFYPNGGRRFQPGCPTNTTLLDDNDFCSHWRAWQILSESIRGGKFVAVRCDSYEDFLAGRCNDNHKTTLDAFSRSKIPKGSYFFVTAQTEPWAIGDDGIIPPPVKTDETKEEEVKEEGDCEKKKCPEDMDVFSDLMRKVS